MLFIYSTNTPTDCIASAEESGGPHLQRQIPAWLNTSSASNIQIAAKNKRNKVFVAKWSMSHKDKINDNYDKQSTHPSTQPKNECLSNSRRARENVLKKKPQSRKAHKAGEWLEQDIFGF